MERESHQPIKSLAPLDILKKSPLSHRLRFGYHFLKAITNPDQTDHVIAAINLMQLKDVEPGGRGILQPESRDFFAQLRQIKGVQELIDSRYNPEHPRLSELKDFPQGSLGHEYAAHMFANQFEQDFYVVESATTDFLWFDQRMKKIHDILHVVYDFGTDVAGELGVQAVMIPQTASHVAGFIVSGGLMNLTFRSPWDLPKGLAAVARGFQLGQESVPFIGFKFEDHWQTPLQELRQLMGMSPWSGGHWQPIERSA